jgi:hypothetical protein
MVVIGRIDNPELTRSETTDLRYSGYTGLVYNWFMSHNMISPKLENIWLYEMISVNLLLSM